MICLIKSSYPFPHKTISKYRFPKYSVSPNFMGLVVFHLERNFFKFNVQTIMFTLQTIEKVFKIKSLVIEPFNRHFIIIYSKVLDFYWYGIFI